MDISIIIVNYNTEKLLKQTIEAVINNTFGIEYEIFVVDNASSDNSVRMIKECFPQIILIENETNEGFSRANNKAIKMSNGRFILLLNSDTVIVDDCLSKCLTYADNNSKVGVLGCKVELPSGQLDKACKRSFPTPENSLYYMLKLDKFFPKNKKIGAYNLTYLDENKINEVEAVVGAFMLVRREAINKAGLLDEDFFMYGEDLDWCYRIKKAGWRIMYYPLAKIIHYKGASGGKKRLKTIYEFHRAMILFYNKHYKKKYNILVGVLVYIGINIKLLFSIILNLFKTRGK